MKRRSIEESDLIRLNLQRFYTLTDTKPVVARLFSATPILPLALVFILGILFTRRTSNLNTLWIILVSIFLLTVFFFVFSLKKDQFHLAFIACLLITFALGMLRYYSIQYAPPHHITHFYGDERELATLEGSVISPVRTDIHPKGISSIPWLNSKSSFYIETATIKTPNGWQQTCGKVRVRVGEPVRNIEPGNKVKVYCWLSRFNPPDNPGQFDLQKHMHQRGVYVSASVPIAEGIKVLQPSSSVIWKIRSYLYYLASDGLFDETLIDQDAKSLASALLFGRRDNLNPQLIAAFQETNLAHFISLSGMHVGILAGSLWILLRTAGVTKRPRAVLCLILILTYALIVPARAPTMRAVFLSCFFFLSVLFKRQPSALNTLSLSALALLFVRPFELFSAGWQLSFMSVLGIIVFYPAFNYQLLKVFLFPISSYLPESLRGVESAVQSVMKLLAVGLSVWTTIAPILLYYFGRVNPLSWLWTILVLPFVTGLLYAGFLKVLLTPIFPTVASALGWIFNHIAIGFEGLVMALAKIDILGVASYRPGMMLVCLIYLLMIIFCLLPGWYWKTRRAALILIVICFFFPAISSHFGIRRQDNLELTFLSVGHGQSAILSGPDNKHILFDSGSITHKQIASKTIIPFLQQQNIFALDAIYLSHGDLDHVNAVVNIAAAIQVDHICANQEMLNQSLKPSVEKELCDELAQMGYVIQPFEQHLSLRNLSIRSIWPDTETLNNESLSENDKSEVIIIQYAGRKIMLCGDIERYAQKRLMELYPDLRVDIMMLPHHGSTNNLDLRFVEAFSPSTVIASCSTRALENTYHPKGDSETQAYYTASDGAVMIKIKADGTLNTTGFKGIKSL